MSMDISCGSLSSKKQKLLNGQGIDWLSDLPDCVLHYVLSFLKTKEVVQTSVLSRRWQYLWTCVANVDLEYSISWMIQDLEQRQNLRKCFLEFMDRLFILHASTNIRELRLKLFIHVENFRLNSWICAVMKHKVQFLDLQFEVEERPTLPLCLFNHHSLVVLKLNVKCTLKATVGAHFPNLKKLYLSRVKFMDDLSVKRLFSNCPVLDELSLVHCKWENIQSVTISIPSLRNLYIGRDPDDGYFTGKRIREYISDSHVKIIATNLACLTFSSYLDINFEVSGLSSLEAASMYVPYAVGVEDEVATRILRLFSHINNVEKMTLFNITVETLRNVEASLARLPTFYNLTHLTVDWILYVKCCDYLLPFLDKMPKLEYLLFPAGCDKAVLAEESSFISDDVRDGIMQKRVPTCFHSSLKTFSIENFEAGRLEIVMIEYVLRNATRLESLFVSSFKDFKEDEFVVDATEYLLKVPRGSESCNIVFSFD